MNSKRKRSIFFLILLFLLVFLFALTAFYPAESCFFPAIVPDGTENALAAYHIAQSGKCGFFLNGFWYPSRYSFILPATFFAPWVWLFSGDILAGVYGCFSAALLLLFSFAGTGKILKSSPAVFLSLPFLLLLPGFIVFCNSAMTEIPYTALLALALFLLVKAASKENFSLPFLILSAIICAWAGGIRSTGYFMLFPFVLLIFFHIKEWKKRFLYWGIAAIPAFLTLCGTLYYNYRIFGSIRRSGYHYWCPVPYDFPSLLFQFSYAEKNLPVLLTTGVLLPFLFFLFSGVLYIFLQRKKQADEKIFSVWKWGFFFVLFHYFILLALYTFHFFCFERFFLPSSALALCTGSIALWRCIRLSVKQKQIKKLAFAFSLSALPVAGLFNYLQPSMQVPLTYSETAFLKFCNKYLPERSHLIINFNPALNSFYLRKDIITLPFSRELEYAGKVIALEKLTDASAFREKMPENAVDHSAALRALPEKKVFTPFPVVIADTFPGKYSSHGDGWHLTGDILSHKRIYITNMALYQIPEKHKERFLRETKLHRVASEGPMELYRVYPAEKF